MSLLLTGGREQMHASSDNDLREITPFKNRIDELCLDLKDILDVQKFEYGEGLAATHKLFADIMVFLQSTFPEEISNTHKGIFGLYDRFGNKFLTTVIFKTGEQEQTVTNASFNPLCVDSTKSGLDWWLDQEFKKKEEILDPKPSQPHLYQRGLNISEKCGIRVKLLIQAYRMCVMAAEAKTPKHTQPTNEERLLQLEVAAIKRRAAAEAMVLAEAKEAPTTITITTTTKEEKKKEDAKTLPTTLETIQQIILELLNLTKTLVKNKECHDLLLD